MPKAAARLGLSQPAMSASLAKLRRHFGDELFTGSATLSANARAGAAQADVHRAARASRVFFRDAEFIPPRARAPSRWSCPTTRQQSRGGAGPSVPRGVPGRASLIHGLTPYLVDGARSRCAAKTSSSCPTAFSPTCRTRTSTRRLGLHRRGGQRGGGSALTLDDLVKMPWVLTFHQRTAFTTAVQQLRMQGVEPRVEIVTENYLSVGPLVVGSRRVAIVQERLAQMLAQYGGIWVLPCPSTPTRSWRRSGGTRCTTTTRVTVGCVPL